VIALLLGVFGCSSSAVSERVDAKADVISDDVGSADARDAAEEPIDAPSKDASADTASDAVSDAGSDVAASDAARASDAATGDASSESGASPDAAEAGADDARLATYEPCPTNGDACRIMPLGDSITDGCCGENAISMGGSYRVELFRLARVNHKKITFVGSHESGPATADGAPFPKAQEGHPGWTIADGGGRSGLQTPVAGWLAATPPHVVLLMIGTNDVDISYDLPNAPARLGTLLDTIFTKAPTALVVLAQIVPTQKDDENQRVRAFNAALPALVAARAAAGKHVTLVDMYGAFTKDAAFKTKLLANALHPSDAGYAAMAQVWWAAIGEVLR
jgi:lysophospholipase L1-like esterase